MDIKEKLLECKSIEDFETLIIEGKFTHKECIQIDNAVETSKFVTSKDFDRLYILLSGNHDYFS